MENLLSMQGRLNRAGYWGRVLIIGCVTVGANFLVGAVTGLMGRGATQAADVVGLLISASVVGLFIVTTGNVIAAFPTVRRLHDLDRPSWHFWLLFVPFYGLWLAILVMFKKGTNGPNQYGADPLTARASTLMQSPVAS